MYKKGTDRLLENGGNVSPVPPTHAEMVAAVAVGEDDVMVADEDLSEDGKGPKAALHVARRRERGSGQPQGY